MYSITSKTMLNYSSAEMLGIVQKVLILKKIIIITTQMIF